VSITDSLRFRIDAANRRYGPFSSTHEALGVASEEFDELRTAIHSNDLAAIRSEALDLAAVALRLAATCDDALAGDTDFGRRSRK
jgi:NTP pyrophosphatase (non-canonical NTP hydrolase)